MGIEQTLPGIPREQYGSSYEDHLLDMYKLYVEMADRISSRRQSANSYFLSISTALVAAAGLTQRHALSVQQWKLPLVIAVAGIVLSYLWYRLVKSYRDLNSGKFEVVHHIESMLPIRPYDAEWKAIGEGKDAKLYKPFTHIEVGVPWVFLFLHLLLALLAIPWSCLGL